MRFVPRRGRILAAMLIPLALFSGLAATPAQAEDGATITGVVYDGSEYTPIADLCVSAYATGSDTVAGTGCTDADGNYTIAGLAEGQYQLHTSAVPGYLATWYGIGTDRSTAYTYDAPGSGYLYLEQGTPVSGTVRDTDGSPVSGAWLYLMPKGDTPARFATSDPEGHWLLHAEPGDYALQTQLTDYRTFYWDGKRREADADVIHVADTPLVLDQRVPDRTTVTGTVRNSAGAPVAGIGVEAVSVADPSIGSFPVNTDASGVYRLLDLGAGTWRMRTADTSGQYSVALSAPFTIADGQTVTGMDLVVTGAGGLSGKAVDRITGAPLAGVCPSAYAGRAGEYVQGQQPTCTDASGAWKITGLAPGKYTVDLQGDATHLARWVADADTQATATLLTVKADTISAVATVRLYRGATLTGRIKAPNGTPLADAYVTLSGFPGRGGPGEGQYSARTGSDGRYTIRNIPPGSLPALVYTGPELPYASQWSGGATDPAKAAKLTFTYAGTTTFNATVKPEGRLKVTVRNAPAGVYTQVDTFTIPSQKPVGWATDIEGSGTGTLTGLPASSVKVRVQYSDDAGTLHTTWYGGATFAKATPVVIHEGAVTTITVKAP